MKIIDFYHPGQSYKIVENYKKQFCTDVKDILGVDILVNELTPELIFLLSHKCQLHWLRTEAQDINELDDFHHEIFEVLTDSEYSQGFLELVQNPQVSFENAVNLTLDFYTRQLELIEQYHISPKNMIQKVKIDPIYQINQDLGDYERQNEIIIGGHPKSIPGSQIILKDQQFDKSNIEDRVHKTINRLSRLTPLCFKRLETFTKYLVPTFSEGMVSFSSESLPFYSCINFQERDDVDLLDDLLHENGHHQLNFFLYQYELINEEDPHLYFSPWRESLRPLRGIYHGFCTFFWACDLFYHLLQNPELDKEFCSSDIEKIKWRFNEEQYLLSMAFPHIQKAYERGYVLEQGLEIAQTLFEKAENYKKNCHNAKLNDVDNKKFQVLREQLEIKRQECEKSL